MGEKLLSSSIRPSSRNQRKLEC
ncbi:hypothetical protein CY0110_19337 [Crocosphaera chwakensis CCY0110]|uniref:Uncharacterized protein n=1 Tax=Crocosphaera chwakensis CCY0110 TaxID=391612 RepID=A3IJJ9_9CHRO|nr:hypothetical protein CY0110_19337 [Crocosphaera chwakensis CCY0110]